MNFLLYVLLFIIFSPKFFAVLGGSRAASVSMTDILFHALLFALGLYVVGYFTRTYHMFEGFNNPAQDQLPTNNNSSSCPAEILAQKSKYKTKKAYNKYLTSQRLTSRQRNACENAY